MQTKLFIYKGDKMEKFFFKLFVLIFLVSCSMEIKAQSADRLKFSGLMFGDYFYNVDQIDNTKKDINGFQFRRIYITTDYSISQSFTSRFRLEADQSALSSNGKITVFVKDAWLTWKNVFDGSNLIMGISPTPAFEVSEKAWGYRSIEKTIMDLNKIVSSRDLGIDLKGKLVESGKISYWIKIGDNSANNPEVNKYKRFYASIHFKPVKNFEFTLYTDFASAPKKKDKINGILKSNNAFVAAAFFGYSNEKLNFGMDSFIRAVQNNYAASSASELLTQKSYGISAWFNANLNEKIGLITRFDIFDPNSDLSSDRSQLYIAGLDFRADDNVSIMPNLEVKTVQNGSSRDVVPRITVYWKF